MQREKDEDDGNDVEEGPTYDITTLNLSGQSTPTEQNLPQRYSLALRSNIITSPAATTTQTASSSVVAKPDIITTEPRTI